MNNTHKSFLELEEKGKSLVYNIDTISLDRFDFILKEIRKGENLFLFDFYLLEKDINLIHRLKLAIHIQFLSTALNFSFFNPFLTGSSVINLPVGLNNINPNDFLLPILSAYEKEIRNSDFPLDKYLQWNSLIP